MIIVSLLLLAAAGVYEIWRLELEIAIVELQNFNSNRR